MQFENKIELRVAAVYANSLSCIAVMRVGRWVMTLGPTIYFLCDLSLSSGQHILAIYFWVSILRWIFVLWAHAKVELRRFLSKGGFLTP